MTKTACKCKNYNNNYRYRCESHCYRCNPDKKNAFETVNAGKDRKFSAVNVLRVLLLGTCLTGLYNPSVALADPAIIQGTSTYGAGGTNSGWGSDTHAGYAQNAGGTDTAEANYSTAWGKDTYAGAGFYLGEKYQNDYATAWGFQSRALGKGATAWGGYELGPETHPGGLATGQASTAFGSSTGAFATNSTAWGAGSVASGEAATAWGYQTQATAANATAWGANTRAAGAQATAWGFNSLAAGDHATAFGSYSNAAATNSLAALGGTVDAGAANSAAIGNGARATLRDTVALGSGSVANRAAGDTDAYLRGSHVGNEWVATENAIAVGDDDAVTRQITGVAAGSRDTDAANVAQLKALESSVLTRDALTSAQVANEARFNAVEHNVDKLENKMEKGLAANNALAALVPLGGQFKTQVSVALGGYENNQALAVGAFHYVNERVLVSTGVAYGGNKSMSYNAGVTFGF